jgi:hypothetical protein
MTSVERVLRSPLVDYFRRGEAPHDVRMLAARGVLAPRAHEQLELLILLVTDPDAEVSGAAEATLQSIPADALAAFLVRPDVSPEIRSFFAARGIVPGGAAPAASDAPLIDATPEPAPAPDNEDNQSTLQRIAAMTVAQRIGLAMKGSREERAILIRDPNKIVAVAVLSSPKMTEAEIESIAKVASISDEILRIIANNRAWTKRYGIIVALARNPKTPVAISMNLLARLTDKDLRAISADRNVPEVLRITARQKIVLNR